MMLPALKRYACPFFLLPFVTLAPGCFSKPSRYSQKYDGLPRGSINVNSIQDAPVRPFLATLTKKPKPYKIGNKTYHPLLSSLGYKKQGIASWYGSKFQGHTTANGEAYNPFAMTGAHKTLPLPTYVKVTNLENGRSTIIRINDRGPFKKHRLVDLSYAAALKLGITAKGTGMVELEAINPKTYPKVAAQTLSKTSPHQSAKIYLQVAAFKDRSRANELVKTLKEHYHTGAELKMVELNHQALFRVRLGPLSDTQKALSLKKQLVVFNLPRSLLIYE